MYAYYPGAADRFHRFAGEAAEDSEYLPWTLRRGVDPTKEPHLFEEESFVCVCGETSLSSGSALEFLDAAVEFANESMWGTLAAGLTVPREFQKTQSQRLDRAVDRLQYGTVGINIWPGVAFALMSTPWGGFPGATLHDIQSGLGSVHNTYLLDHIEKTVLSSPLAFLPKPVWFPTHQFPERLASNLLNLYLRPSVWGLPSLLWNALRG
jgi:aldehyde dehydrogenase (NAD(P)+)